MLSLGFRKFGAHENGRESELVELAALGWILRRCRLEDTLGETVTDLGDEDKEMEEYGSATLTTRLNTASESSFGLLLLIAPHLQQQQWNT